MSPCDDASGNSIEVLTIRTESPGLKAASILPLFQGVKNPLLPPFKPNDRTVTCATTNQILVAACPLQDGADGYAAGAFGDVWLGVFEPGEAGDVEVNPGGVFREDFQKLSGGDGSAVTATGVFDVGDVALDLLGVLVSKGEAPEFFA